MAKSKVTIYCDGACSDNHKKINAGGWGVVIQQTGKLKKFYGGEKNTTNNRMELTACIKGLEEVRGKETAIELYSDSAYLVNCINQQWYVKWQRNGWITSQKNKVENQDLWIIILELISRKRVVFKKVKGHSGVKYNEMADELANLGVAGLKENPSGFQKQIEDNGLSENERSQFKDSRLTYRQVEGGYFLRLLRGAKVMETLIGFMSANKINAGSITAIGALENIDLGYYRLSDKKYFTRNFPETYELVSFMGNIAYLDGKPFIHAHAVISDEKCQPFAGHFFDGIVAGTMEVKITVFTEKITRSPDRETGLNLLDLD